MDNPEPVVMLFKGHGWLFSIQASGERVGLSYKLLAESWGSVHAARSRDM